MGHGGENNDKWWNFCKGMKEKLSQANFCQWLQVSICSSSWNSLRTKSAIYVRWFTLLLPNITVRYVFSLLQYNQICGKYEWVKTEGRRIQRITSKLNCKHRYRACCWYCSEIARQSEIEEIRKPIINQVIAIVGNYGAYGRGWWKMGEIKNSQMDTPRVV